MVHRKNNVSLNQWKLVYDKQMLKNYRQYEIHQRLKNLAVYFSLLRELHEQNYFIIEMQIITCFDHICCIQNTEKSIYNEYTKYIGNINFHRAVDRLYMCYLLQLHLCLLMFLNLALISYNDKLFMICITIITSFNIDLFDCNTRLLRMVRLSIHVWAAAIFLF